MMNTDTTYETNNLHFFRLRGEPAGDIDLDRVVWDVEYREQVKAQLYEEAINKYAAQSGIAAE